MDIRDWPIDKIMQLPDCAFGQRWWVGTYCGDSNGRAGYFTVDENLPDKFVVWGIVFCCRAVASVNPMRVTVRLGTHLIANAADALSMDRIFKGISSKNIVYEFYLSQWDLTWLDCKRIIVDSAGRKIQLMTNGDQVTAYEMTVAVLISSVPRDIPYWIGKNYGY